MNWPCLNRPAIRCEALFPVGGVFLGTEVHLFDQKIATFETEACVTVILSPESLTDPLQVDIWVSIVGYSPPNTASTYKSDYISNALINPIS